MLLHGGLPKCRRHLCHAALHLLCRSHGLSLQRRLLCLRHWQCHLCPLYLFCRLLLPLRPFFHGCSAGLRGTLCLHSWRHQLCLCLSCSCWRHHSIALFFNQLRPFNRWLLLLHRLCCL